MVNELAILLLLSVRGRLTIQNLLLGVTYADIDWSL